VNLSGGPGQWGPSVTFCGAGGAKSGVRSYHVGGIRVGKARVSNAW